MRGTKRELDAFFKAIGNARRREIVNVIGTGSKTPGEIAKAFDCTWPAISRHLQILRKAAVVYLEDEFDPPRYMLNYEAFDAATKWVSEYGAP